jgi:hypothetical protein
MLALYSLLHLASMVVLVAISLPVAALLCSRAVGVRWPVRAALLIAICGLAAPAVPDILFPRYVGPPVALSGAVDLIKFVCVLPALTWLIGSRLPSNNSFKPNLLRKSA